MYGFPEELYAVHYEPKSDVAVAYKVIKALNAKVDNTWGIDHGVWSVLSNMYPEADVPRSDGQRGCQRRSAESVRDGTENSRRSVRKAS
jgi:hypothetical protein